MLERVKSWIVCRTDLQNLPMPTAVVSILSSLLYHLVLLLNAKLKPAALSLYVTSGIDYKTTTILLDGRRVKLELW